VKYLITISDEDEFGGSADSLGVALEAARELSGHVDGDPRWDGADICVWEHSDDANLGPVLDRMVARFHNGQRVPLHG
jgi:hypothetical protein